MTNQRKQIIINEITFWKQNKLLPEHYCDFLMTLYMEGEQPNEEIIGNAKQSVMGKQRSALRFQYLLAPVLAVIIIAAMYILTNPYIILIGAIIYSAICIGYAIYFAKKNHILSPLLQLTGALVLLFATFKICIQYYPGNDMALYMTLIGNCALWLVSGLLMRVTYFSVAGALGLLAILIYSIV